MKKIRWLCNLFIDSTKGAGIPLGNQISQVFALLYLHKMDCMITKELNIKYYGRYMDDFYLICRSKEHLEYCLKRIEECVKKLKLTLNSKTQIIPFKNGIDFLGFHTYVTKDGKVIRKLKGSNKRHVKKELLKKSKLVLSGKMTMDKFMESYISWKNHALHGNCIKLVHSMDKFVEMLFKDKKEKDMPKRIAKFEKVSFEQFKEDFNKNFPDYRNEEILKIYESITLPERKTSGSAGYDFVTPIGFGLAPGATVTIPTGIRCKMDTNWVLKLYPRSGLGFKFRLQLNNTVGIIDSDYYNSDNEGHIMAKITNDTKECKTLAVNALNGFMQGVFVEYGITEDDNADGIRNGGTGSTDK